MKLDYNLTGRFYGCFLRMYFVLHVRSSSILCESTVYVNKNLILSNELIKVELPQ